MSESVNLPALGESVTEGTVTRWLKSVGDRVEVDEPLVEVSTDKVDTEIPSPVAGVLEEILVHEDETVEVGAALARIGSGDGAAASNETPTASNEKTETPQENVAAEEPIGEEPAEAATEQKAPEEDAAQAPSSEKDVAEEEAPQEQPTPAAKAPVQEPETKASSESAATRAPAKAAAAASPAGDTAAGSSGYVTPLVRQLAQQHGVDLHSVKATGVGGRITKQDVLAAAQGGSGAKTAAPKKPEPSPLRGTTVPMSRLRKVVAERAVASMVSTAQLTTVVEVDVTAVARFRDRVKADFAQKTGNKLSFLPFFALAATEALAANPIINATVDGDTIVYPATENVSIAVDTERGLLTPVVKDAARLNIAGFAAEIADLAERTRNNQLKPDELAGGTFTLTNTGSRGALFDTPVVFLPQSAILGTGIVVKKPVVISDGVTDAVAIRQTVFLALSYDHRIIDGADAARFLTTIKTRLEAGDFADDLGI